MISELSHGTPLLFDPVVSPRYGSGGSSGFGLVGSVDDGAPLKLALASSVDFGAPLKAVLGSSVDVGVLGSCSPLTSRSGGSGGTSVSGSGLGLIIPLCSSSSVVGSSCVTAF